MQDEFHNSVPMVLRRLRPATLARPLRTHTHFHLAPRLDFTLVNQAAEKETVRVEQILRRSSGERVVQREELVKRILAKGERRDGATHQTATSATAAVPPPLAPRGVPAVLLRPAAPAPAVPNVPESPAQQGAWPAAAPMQPTLPDVERLSEQVMRNIDRRLQAHRERLGRR